MNPSKKITWIKIASRRYGGVIYGEKVREALSPDFELKIKEIKVKYLKLKYLKPLEWFWSLLRLKGESDFWVRDNIFSIATLPFNKTRGKNLAIVYHLDSSVKFPLIFRPFYFLLEKIFYSGLRKADLILTISQYWQNYFLQKGYQKVEKISPAFDLADFQISEQEIAEFKKKYNLREKPIIYLGNCQRAKGVVEAYQALKDLDLHLITSGEPMVKIPARNLNLSYQDYLKLLKASLIVLTMSKFNEGWCMTAHEAMLLKTPVIGSGRGGMRELLEGGKQIICQDFQALKEKVEHLLNHPEVREKMGQDGFNFAQNFTLKKFQKDWLNLIENMIS